MVVVWGTIASLGKVGKVGLNGWTVEKCWRGLGLAKL